MNDYAFSMTMEVRNYECDLQGIVGNSIYLNYLQHARHEFLKQNGIDFVEYARQGINMVIVRAELDYKHPLTAGDRFIIGLDTARESKVRFAFYQDIYRAEDKKLVLKAKIIGTALDARGRPSIPKQFEALFP
uniref:Acyl-CoA thioester hydrolase n=1 Tax=Candidatus Kentrum sp. LFY TaxID=2126342 RepID=A0A450UD40_9GAMM|nr:MAG: acyl-CoA thioester hydrolase [Candidatus Kentron sp. LFY]VFK19023.1 MAG: acyl-CoA thioester hydrolase [Candidatus Kentron sp. LFY]